MYSPSSTPVALQRRTGSRLGCSRVSLAADLRCIRNMLECPMETKVLDSCALVHDRLKDAVFVLL